MRRLVLLFRPQRVGVLEGLAALSPFRAYLLSLGLFALGAALPYLVVPEPLGLWRPSALKPFHLEDLLRPFLNNALLALVLSRGLPWLEARFLSPGWSRGWSSRLYLLLAALTAGLQATPHGLPQGVWYLLWLSPLAFLEFGAYALALARLEGWAFGVLLLAALYEAVMVRYV
jgi:hypothetical protein